MFSVGQFFPKSAPETLKPNRRRTQLLTQVFSNQHVQNTWGTSHPGWPPNGQIVNSRLNRKTEEKIRTYNDIGFSAI